MTEDMRAKILRKLQAGEAAASEARRLRGVIDSAVRRIETERMTMCGVGSRSNCKNFGAGLCEAIRIIREEDGNG